MKYQDLIKALTGEDFNTFQRSQAPCKLTLSIPFSTN